MNDILEGDKVRVTNKESVYFGLVGWVTDIQYGKYDVMSVNISGRSKGFYRNELEKVEKR